MTHEWRQIQSHARAGSRRSSSAAGSPIITCCAAEWEKKEKNTILESTWRRWTRLEFRWIKTAVGGPGGGVLSSRMVCKRMIHAGPDPAFSVEDVPVKTPICSQDPLQRTIKACTSTPAVSPGSLLLLLLLLYSSNCSRFRRLRTAAKVPSCSCCL